MIPSDYFQVIQKLYVAYFGRPADPAGLQFYAELLAGGNAPNTSEGFVSARDANPAVRAMLEGFGNSAESQAFYGTDSLQTHVKQIYQNVLGRDAEPAGLAYWTQEIAQGRLSLANASFIILQAGEKDIGGDARGVEAKVMAAVTFTNALDTPAEKAAYSGAAAAAQARAMLSTITSDSTPTAIQASIEKSVASLGTPAPAPAPAPDTVAPTLVISTTAGPLQAGQSATLTFTFSEDVGTSFTDSDITVAGGTLSALSGSGLTRTATFTAAAATSLSAGGQVWVQADSYQDAAGNTGNASKGASALDIGTVFNKVLFVGNSATFARIDPVMHYNTYNATTNPGGVHDLTSPSAGGTFTNILGSNLYEAHDWGGVAGLFDKFADQVNLGYDVSLSTRNAATLKGHYLNSSPAGWDLRGNIASQKWEMVVLQDQTDEPLPSGSGSITFAAGSSTASLVITPTSDALKEYDETLTLTLAAASGYRVGTTANITTTLLNDDPTPPVINPALPTVTLAASPGAVAEDGNANLVFTFSRTGDTSADLLVSFTVFRDGSTSPSVAAGGDLEVYNTTTGALVTTGGSPYRFSNGSGFATSGTTAAPTTTGSVAFTGTSGNTGTILIKAGQTSASLTIDPKADVTVENDESIRITLTGTAYNIGTAGAVTGTIVNDDFADGVDTSLPNITLGLSSAASTYESSGQNLVYTFTRSGDASSALTVNFNATGNATYFSGDASKSDFGVAAGSGASAVSLTTTSGANADIAEFQKYATLIERYIHSGAADTTTTPGTTIAGNANADAATNVYLYATWARPDMVAGAWDMITDSTLVTSGAQTGANGGTGSSSRSDTQAAGYYLNIESMTADLANAYENLAQVNTAFKGVAPAGKAFLKAVQDGLAIRDPYTETAGGGKVNLWYDDNLHASKYGSYLAGLALFETLTGIDAQAMGAGDKVASDLGIDAATAVALQRVASATAGFDQALRWNGPGSVKDLGGTNVAAMLATAGGFSFSDPAQTVHTVSVQSQSGNLGTLTATVRSDGNTGQVNWIYKVDNGVVDPLLETGQQRVDSFTVVLDDGHGHVSAKLVGISMLGA